MGKQAMSMRFAEERVMEVLAQRRAGVQPSTARQGTSQVGDASLQDDCSGDGEAAHVDFIPRARKRTYELDKETIAGVNHQKSLKIEEKFPPFGPRSFLTFEEFETAWAYYCAKHFGCYRSGHTIGRDSANTKREKDYAKAMENAIARGVDLSGPLRLIPSTLTHEVMTIKCVHGYKKENRGVGLRVHSDSRYFACLAQIRARVVYNVDEDRWEVICDNENRTHNHHCEFESYVAHLNTSEIKNPDLRKELQTMVSVLGKSRIILDKVNRVLPFSRRQLENFKAYRQGGLRAVDGLYGLLLRFTDFEGNFVLIIEDQDGVTIGIGLQTKMQRQIFLEYGDNIIFDWTHNTNNVGYYLGSFLVTTASGKGVSVFDMLCLTQSKDMMRAFFQHFVETNPGARERVQSFVIDKDYREWKVLEEVFFKSVVVLCQFHVLKWLTFVVAQDKYAIPVALRVDVLRSLRIMVYAASAEDFTHQQLVLKNLLAADHHQPFLQYLNDRWYNCTRMWANCLRGDVFTAGNTTSNRLESFWRRYKEDLGFRQRVDKCLEAIFLHATSVLKREKDEFVNHSTSVSLSAATIPFLEPLLRDLGEFTAPLVKLQWMFYAGAPTGAYQLVDAQELGEPTTLVVRVTAQRPVDFSVCTRLWTCTCHFFRGSGLPCRHLMFVADSVRKMEFYPVATLASRWSMSRAASFIGDLVRAIDELSLLRTDLLPQESEFEPEVSVSHDVKQPPGTAGPGLSFSSGLRPDISISSTNNVEETQRSKQFRQRATSAGGAFAIMQLRQGEVSDCVIMDQNAKDRVVTSQFERLKECMKGLGSARFRECSIELDGVLAGLIEKWTIQPRGSREEGSASPESFDQGAREGDGPRLLQEARALSATRVSEAAAVAQDHEGDGLSTDVGLSTGVVGEAATAEATQSREFAPVDGDEQFEESEAFWRSSTINHEEDFYMCEEDIPVVPVWQLTAANDWQGRHHKVREVLSQPDLLRNLPRRGRFEFTGMDEVLASADGQEMLRDAVVSSFPFSSTLLDELMMGTDDIEAPVVTNTSAEPDPAVTSMPVVTSSNVPARSRVVLKPRAFDEATTRRTQIYKLKVPRPVSSGKVKISTYKMTVTGRAQTTEHRSDCPVDVAEFLTILSHCKLSRASSLLPNYPTLYEDTATQNRLPTARKEIVVEEPLNFKVPGRVLAKLVAILPPMPPSSSENPVYVDAVNTRGQKQFVAKFAVDIRGFTRGDIDLLREFERAEQKLKVYTKDLEWLEGDSFWSVPKCQPAVDFLVAATEGLDATDAEDPFHTTKMRTAILSALEPTSLETNLHLPSRTLPLGLAQEPVKRTRILVGDIIGRVGCTQWLNDSAVNFSINMLAASFEDVVVVDSLNLGNLVSMRENVQSTRLVVFPIYFENDKHWCSICVVLNWETGSHAAFAYDPDKFGKYEEKVASTWKDWCVPLLKAWCKEGQTVLGGTVPLTMARTPKQDDGHSCGVHVILHTYNWMWNRVPTDNSPSLTPFAVNVMRLRILWLLVCNSIKSSDSTRAKNAGESADKFEDYARGDSAVRRMTRSQKRAERSARGRGRGRG